MVVGASGTGRTTFVNAFCGHKVFSHNESINPATANTEQPVKIRPASIELDEIGSRVSLTVIDTPGLGTQLDSNDAIPEILGYLERQYDDILAEETRIKRNPRFRDNRVHCVLYFIQPTGHGLRELDIEVMKQLSPRANVIPLIAKADSLTRDEVIINKRLIMEDLEHYRIPIYNFPFDPEDDDEDIVQENSTLRNLMPFAIVSSEEHVEVNGRSVLGRQYHWGVAEMENPGHSDFIALRNALLQSHLADLREITHDFLYENYRTERLSMPSLNDGLNGNMNNYVPNEIASQSARLKEEKLRREEERIKENEIKAQQRELEEKRRELLAKEEALKSLERRLASASPQSMSNADSSTVTETNEQ